LKELGDGRQHPAVRDRVFRSRDNLSIKLVDVSTDSRLLPEVRDLVSALGDDRWWI
jgi:hypothetical protein